MITILDNWYSTNLLNTDYEDYISDTLFCNDRQLESEVGGEGMGTGFGSSLTCYAGRHRLEVIETNKTPSLKWGLKNDRFTVDDITIGNGALTYPIGLLTASELSIVGIVNSIQNSTNYLYTNQYWWTFSPEQFAQGEAYFFQASSYGNINDNSPRFTSGVRPVINLKPVTLFSGSGTIADPYIVE